MFKKVGEPGFLYNIKELIERISKAVTDSNQQLIEETKPKTKAIMELDESNDYKKTLELMIKIGVIHSNLMGPMAKPLVLEKK